MRLPGGPLWLQQARSDYEAAQHLLAANQPTWNCHIAAKYQQAVEKAVKSLVDTLDGAKIISIKITFGHEVDGYIETMLLLPRPKRIREIQRRIKSLFNERDRATIHTLIQIAPRQPQPGGLFRRNTEYPYQSSETEWTIPASATAFSAGEIEQFGRLAARLLDGTDRVVQTLSLGRRARQINEQ